MKKNVLSEILLELYQKDKTLYGTVLFLLDTPREIDLQKGKLPLIQNNNQFFLFVKSGYTDIKKGTVFNVIIPNENVMGYLEVNITLKYISVNPSYEIDYIPDGYSALCLFEFERGIPEIIKKLPYYTEKFDYSKHQRLVLTQKQVLERVLEEYDKLKDNDMPYADHS